MNLWKSVLLDLDFPFTAFSEVGWVRVCCFLPTAAPRCGRFGSAHGCAEGRLRPPLARAVCAQGIPRPPRAPVLFQPLVHLEDTPKHCLCPLLQLEQRCVRPAQQEYPLVAHLAWPLAFSF